jgi:hypothetical protein
LKFFKEVAVLMKELAKNLRFRVGSLTWFFDSLRTLLRLKTNSLSLENRPSRGVRFDFFLKIENLSGQECTHPTLKPKPTSSRFQKQI